MTQLSGKQIEDLVDALIHAYPSEADLAMMVRIELNKTLATVAAGSNLRVLIFNLITWAERSGRVNELVAGAVRRTPGNSMMQEYVRRWPAAAAPIPIPVSSYAPSGSAAIDIFLCYSRQNLAAMREVEAVLRGAGFSVWTDEKLEPGTPSWTDAIEEAVAQAKAMVVLLSPAAKGSKWVKREVAEAEEHGKLICPILIEGDTRSAVPLQLRDVQWVDGRQGLQEAVGRVLAQMDQEKRSGALSAVSAGDKELDALTRRAAEAEKVLAQAQAEAAAQAAAEEAARKRDDEKAALQQRIEDATREAFRLRVQRDPLGALEQIGLEWVMVPAGEFTMGGNAYSHERPIHQVHLSEYQIARHPVTNAQYELFVKAKSYVVPKHWKNRKIPPGKENHPVVYVSWEDVRAFCAWAGVCLPTEAEWEKAARGTDGRKYPWGNEPPTRELCNFNGYVGDTTPVGRYPKGASPYGALDMAGNVWEWVNDWYDEKYYSVSPAKNPQGPATGLFRVLRGGSWDNNVDVVRSAYRDGSNPDGWIFNFGFRCVRSL